MVTRTRGRQASKNGTLEDHVVDHPRDQGQTHQRAAPRRDAHVVKVSPTVAERVQHLPYQARTVHGWLTRKRRPGELRSGHETMRINKTTGLEYALRTEHKHAYQYVQRGMCLEAFMARVVRRKLDMHRTQQGLSVRPHCDKPMHVRMSTTKVVLACSPVVP